MIINITNEQSDIKISPKQVRSLVREVIAHENHRCDEVSLYFVDTPTISQLHAQYFNDPSSTDCISFPMDFDQDDPIFSCHLGEIFVCPATAIDYAAKNNENPCKETSLYIIHGLLHLMGYDDIEEEDIILMRKAEQKHLENLKEKNLILS